MIGWLKGEELMETKISMEQASSYMVLVLVTSLLIDKLDDLKNTNIWSGKLKVAGDQFRIQAERLLRQELHKHFGKNEELSQNIMNNFEEFLEKFSKIEPIGIFLVNQYWDSFITEIKGKPIEWTKLR
jgi:hypothetical protein|uniref:Uncharacterized protein n=1 Tax=Ackermannviridae sp. ctUml7 TaxID=2825753 RepID=A0A8S5V9L0_9CAUD|nr:MAG TPA: hypothetical protein [Ackermannviridae sp. ctUml7]